MPKPICPNSSKPYLPSKQLDNDFITLIFFVLLHQLRKRRKLCKAPSILPCLSRIKEWSTMNREKSSLYYNKNTLSPNILSFENSSLLTTTESSPQLLPMAPAIYIFILTRLPKAARPMDSRFLIYALCFNFFDASMLNQKPKDRETSAKILNSILFFLEIPLLLLLFLHQDPAAPQHVA